MLEECIFMYIYELNQSSSKSYAIAIVMYVSHVSHNIYW